MYIAIERVACTFLLVAAILAVLFFFPDPDQAIVIATAITGILAAYLAQRRKTSDSQEI